MKFKEDERKELKNCLKFLEIEDLADIIKTEPIISGKNDLKAYTKKQRKEIKNLILQIAELTFDLAMIEENYLLHNLKYCEENGDIEELINKLLN